MTSVLLGFAALGYLISAFGFHYNLFHRRLRDWRGWTRLLLLSHAFHTGGLVGISIQRQHLPFTTMSEAMASLGWVLVAFYALLGKRWKVEALGYIAAPAAAVLTTFATFSLDQHRLHPHDSAWFPLHVSSLVASYAAFCLATFCALLYFLQSRKLKQKKLSSAFLLPSLDTLDRVAFRFILVGFPLLVMGMVSGTQMPGWKWNWDAKETMVGATGLFYLVYLHARILSGWQGRRINSILLMAFICLVISLLAPGGDHGY